MSDKTMPLLEHLVELRNVLIKSVFALLIGTVIAAIFTPQILQFLIAPYGATLQTIDPTENISIYLRVSIMSGAVITMPVFVYLLWSFIAPGLEKKEKRYVRLVVPGATILFLIGVAFAWGIMLPAAISFLSTFQAEIFKSDWRADAYIPFVTSLMFWIGVSFETPMIVFFLAKLHVVTARQLLQGWRYAIVVIAVLAAMITPTVDPFNMALVMAPLILLYFFSVLLAKLA
ncbi:Sec-independent protein translocase protein TatC [Anaerolineae bacterium]|nr:Sec-independent protein translocase protein TatC [Anaerolineae bacterium]